MLPPLPRRAAAVLAAALLAVAGCGRPAQIGPDKDCFNAVDALYTAVTSRRPELLDRCDQNLRRLKESGKVPEDAYESLQAVIAKARDGKWESAAKDLDWLIRGQERSRPRP